jgi:signal peptidase I
MSTTEEDPRAADPSDPADPSNPAAPPGREASAAPPEVGAPEAGPPDTAPAEGTPEPGRSKSTWGRNLVKHLTELPMLVLIAFAIAILIKTFLVQAFYIPSASMNPTLVKNDRVLVEKISYLLHDPRRGDVVVFEKSVFGQSQDVPWHQDAQNFMRELLGLPTGLEEDYIKRVVAVGGDTIRYAGTPRRLMVNGEEVDQSYVKGGRDRSSSTLTSTDCERLEMERRGKGCVVPAGRLFVMGDNRGDSEDSRILGPIEEDKVIGRAFVIIWPPSDFGSL